MKSTYKIYEDIRIVLPNKDEIHISDFGNGFMNVDFIGNNTLIGLTHDDKSKHYCFLHTVKHCDW